jgi:hypothetical protein
MTTAGRSERRSRDGWMEAGRNGRKPWTARKCDLRRRWRRLVQTGLVSAVRVGRKGLADVDDGSVIAKGEMGGNQKEGSELAGPGQYCGRYYICNCASGEGGNPADWSRQRFVLRGLDQGFSRSSRAGESGRAGMLRQGDGIQRGSNLSRLRIEGTGINRLVV